MVFFGPKVKDLMVVFWVNNLIKGPFFETFYRMFSNIDGTTHVKNHFGH